MKKYIVIFIFLVTHFGFSQVGIGTDNPTPGYALDVNGDALVQDEVKLNLYPDGALTDDSFNFLVRLLNSSPPGEVAYLDLTSLAVGPVNVADYVFTNLQKDNVTSVDLKYSSEKYIVGLANFQYQGEHIVKGAGANIGHFRARTFVNDGTWHIEMRNVTLDSPNDDAITYYATIIIYDRKYFKELPTISRNFGGGTTNTAPVPAGLP